MLTGEAVPHSGATPYVVFGNWPVVSLLGLLLLPMAVRAGRGFRPSP
ncbi:MAG TPA: hypothetical protein VJ437_08535 [Acidiferrobacterales bacterium]|nr:hypothetical protein [Acidiferrobacterales bacterium]